jgi:hypothetical protein
MTTRRQGKASLAAATALVLGILPFASAQADTTGYLSPTTAGTYQTWIRGDDVTQVNDFVGCDVTDTSTWATNNTVLVGGRSSAVIDIASIPDGATIDSIDIQVCQTRGALGGSNALFQTFVRVDGADTDSGVDIDTGNDPNVQETTIQTIPVGVVVQAGVTTLEVGVIKTSGLNVNATLVYSLAAQVNFTPASGPIAPGAATPVPVFGPLGLLFTALGVGLVGLWQARRRS